MFALPLLGFAASLALAASGTWEETIEAARRLTMAGRYSDALPVLSDALKMAESFGPMDERLAVTLDNLGFLHFQLGDYAAAERFFQRSVRVWEKLGASGQTGIDAPLNNLGMLYRYEQRTSKAVEVLGRVYRNRLARLGADHPDVALSMCLLAESSRTPNDLETAETLLRRSLAREKNADLASNLGSICRIRGRSAEAAEAFALAVEIWEHTLGPSHPTLGEGLTNLGGLYVEAGRYNDAEPMLQRAFSITVAALGPDHPQVGRILAYQAVLFRKTGRGREAKQVAARARQILEANRKENLLDQSVDIRALSQH